MSAFGKQHVVQFQIAIDDRVRVQIVQCQRDLTSVESGMLLGQSTLTLHVVHQITATYELDDKEQTTRRLEARVQADQERVVRGDLEDVLFGLHPVDVLVVAHQRLLDHLHRVDALGLLQLDHHHLRVRTATDHTQQIEVVDRVLRTVLGAHDLVVVAAVVVVEVAFLLARLAGVRVRTVLNQLAVQLVRLSAGALADRQRVRMTQAAELDELVAFLVHHQLTVHTSKRRNGKVRIKRPENGLNKLFEPANASPHSPEALATETENAILAVGAEGALIEALQLENVSVHFVQFLPSSSASTIDGLWGGWMVRGEEDGKVSERIQTKNSNNQEGEPLANTYCPLRGREGRAPMVCRRILSKEEQKAY